MPTYNQQDNFQARSTPLYTPDWNLIANVQQTDQRKYNIGVQRVRTAYNDVLGLNVVSPYAQNRMAGMMQIAQNKLKDMAGANFSKDEQIATAQNIFTPIATDQDLLADSGATRHTQGQMQSAFAMRDSKDADQRAAFNYTNLKDVSRPLQKLAQATTREDMYKWSSEARNRTYVPYQDVVNKLNKKAKDSGLKFTIEQVNGAYIVHDEFGQVASPALRNFAFSNMDQADLQQLRTNARVVVEDLEDQGFSKAQIAGNLYSKYTEIAKDKVSDLGKMVGGLQQEIKALEDRGVAINGLDAEDTKTLQLKRDQMASVQQSLDTARLDYQNYLTKKPGTQQGKLYQEFLNNPSDKATELAYEQTAKNWAQNYAETHYVREIKDNKTYLDLYKMNQEHQENMAKLAITSSTKSKSETKEKTEDDVLNTPVNAGQSAFANVTPETNIQQWNRLKQDAFTARNNAWHSINSKYAGSVGLSNTTLAKMYNYDKRTLPKEITDELQQLPLFQNVDLSTTSGRDVINIIAENAMKDANSEISKGTPKGREYFNSLLAFDTASRRSQHLDEVEKSSPYLSELLKNKDLIGGQDVISREEYINRKVAENQKASTNRSLADIVKGGGPNSGKVTTMEQIREKFGQEYDQRQPTVSRSVNLMKQDPRLKELIFSENYPYLDFTIDAKHPNTIGPRAVRQLVTEESLGDPANIDNIDEIITNMRLSPNDETRREVTNELRRYVGSPESFNHFQVESTSISGSPVFKFRFDEKALQQLKDTNDKGKAVVNIPLARALAITGVAIKANKPIAGLDLTRENFIESELARTGRVDFKANQLGDIGFSIWTESTDDGGTIYKYRLNSKDVKKNAENKPIVGPDGKYVIAPVYQDGVLLNTTTDEAYDTLKDALYRSYQSYVAASSKKTN